MGKDKTMTEEIRILGDDDNKITFLTDEVPVLILTSQGFKYKGEYIDDPKDACARFHEWLDTTDTIDTEDEN